MMKSMPNRKNYGSTWMRWYTKMKIKNPKENKNKYKVSSENIFKIQMKLIWFGAIKAK